MGMSLIYDLHNTGHNSFGYVHSKFHPQSPVLSDMYFVFKVGWSRFNRLFFDPLIPVCKDLMVKAFFEILYTHSDFQGCRIKWLSMEHYSFH